MHPLDPPLIHICCIYCISALWRTLRRIILEVFIVYLTYLCVVCLECSPCRVRYRSPLLVVTAHPPCATGYLSLALSPSGILRAADVCPHYLSVYTTSPFLSSVLFFLVFSSPVPWLDLSDFFFYFMFFSFLTIFCLCLGFLFLLRFGRWPKPWLLDQ